MTQPAVTLVPQGAAAPEEWRALESDAVVLRHSDWAAVKITGTGRVPCLQGLVTCDVVKPGDGARMFGALLTVKGMIVSPLWIARLEGHVLVEMPAAAAPEVLEVLMKSLPPRLARGEDITPTHSSLGIYGPKAADVLTRVLGESPPAEGGALIDYANESCAVMACVARGLAGYDLVLPVSKARVLMDDLVTSGARPASAALAEVCRIEAGIPRLGAEIDEKTLPQEVRCEELGAISYTKGCYLGQETVARLHFRGHANRRLVALALDRAPHQLPLALLVDGRSVGRITSAAWSNGVDAWVGLGVVRRETEDGANLTIEGGGEATVRVASWLRAP